jgi:hypothetical protein
VASILHSTSGKAIYLLPILMPQFEMPPYLKVPVMFQPPVSMEACISHAQMHQMYQDELYTALSQYEIYG